MVDCKIMIGTAIGIGVGPGDPELMTIKGARILAGISVVAYPAPLTGDSLARRIAASHLPQDATKIIIRMPLSANRFPVEGVYDRAAEEIGFHLGAGRDVAILCEGDPFLRLLHVSVRTISRKLAGRSCAWCLLAHGLRSGIPQGTGGFE
jgi:precorrin-2 methylase